MILLSIKKIEPTYTKEFMLGWLIEEVATIRDRFGNDKEAMKFWPNNYYEKMEKWWATDKRNIDPLSVTNQGSWFRIEDGWHRLAISHKLGLLEIPVVIIDFSTPSP